MDYFHSIQDFKPTKGSLLISEPFLPDPNFERSVVLLCEHDENGSMGYILNKSTELCLDEVIKQVTNASFELFTGGPMQQNTLHFIHRNYDLMQSGNKIGEDLYWDDDYDRLFEVINNGEVSANEFKFFLGYSGWSENQLEEEIKEKSWIVRNQIETSRLFESDEKHLWKDVLEDFGGKFKMFSNYPENPKLN